MWSDHLRYLVAFPLSKPPSTFVQTAHVFSHDFVTLDAHSWHCMLAGQSRSPKVHLQNTCFALLSSS